MNEPEAEVFREAVERLNIKTTDAPHLFGCTRQTLASWTKGNVTKIPKAAFITLLAMENAAFKKTYESMKEANQTARIVRQIAGLSASAAPDQPEKP